MARNGAGRRVPGSLAWRTLTSPTSTRWRCLLRRARRSTVDALGRSNDATVLGLPSLRLRHCRWTGLQNRASVSVIQDESEKKPGQSAGLFHSLEVLLNHPLAGRRAFLARDHDNVVPAIMLGMDSAGLGCTFSHQGTHVGEDLNGVDAFGQIHHACS